MPHLIFSPFADTPHLIGAFEDLMIDCFSSKFIINSVLCVWFFRSKSAFVRLFDLKQYPLCSH